MKTTFKALLINNYRHNKPTDTRNYRYIVEPLFKSCDGQTLYRATAYKQYDREAIDRPDETNPINIVQFWY